VGAGAGPRKKSHKTGHWGGGGREPGTACGRGEAGALVVGMVVGRMAAVWLCVLEGGREGGKKLAKPLSSG